MNYGSDWKGGFNDNAKHLLKVGFMIEECNHYNFIDISIILRKQKVASVGITYPIHVL